MVYIGRASLLSGGSALSRDIYTALPDSLIENGTAPFEQLFVEIAKFRLICNHRIGLNSL